MEPAEYLEHLRQDGGELAAAAGRAPGARVPACPDWDTTGLVGHTAVIHRWVSAMLQARATQRISRRDLPSPPPEATDARAKSAAVLAWYRQGLDELLAALAAIDPEEPVWNWSPDGDRRARFWFRRMAQETAVHRWDAQAAAEDPHPIDTALAADGVDEFFELQLPVALASQPVAALSGSLHLHATDTDGEWWVALHPDHLERRHQHAKADTAVRGSASSLLLWLWNRVPDHSAELETFGREAMLDHLGSFRF